MSSPESSPLSIQLDRALAQHRAGHFDKARGLLNELETQPASPPTEEERRQIASFRERFRPDGFAWLMLIGGLILLAVTVASTWH